MGANATAATGRGHDARTARPTKDTPKCYGSLRAAISMALAMFTAVSAISVIRAGTSPLNLS
jgi:hypothetical protein